MLATTVRCEQCGYDNDPRHRFCGMCGAKLALPLATAPKPPAVSPVSSNDEPWDSLQSIRARREPPPPPPKGAPVSGPSLLGLSDESTNSNVTYLFEDEERSTHWGRIFVLLLFIAIGVSAWHWRQEVGTWAVKLSRDSAVAPTQVMTQAPPAPDGTQQPPPTTAAQPNQTQAGAQPASATPNGSQAAPANPPAAGQANPPATAPANPAATAAAPPPAQANSAPAQPPAQPPAQTTAASTPPETAKPPATPAAERTPESPAAEGLEAEGEKYLYGTGVSANCDRARKDLTDAAGQSNEKAQSVLATMYATGHCVPRDPALAYRWFAKALHEDPNNGRLKRDLEVLWNQMSADEKQMAMRSQP